MKKYLPTLTDLRRVMQNRSNDRFLLATLSDHFDPIPAAAMLKHRVPPGQWRLGQVDGTGFHNALTSALRQGTSTIGFHSDLVPALTALQLAGFEIAPEVEAEIALFDDPLLGLRGKLDLLGWVRGVPAVIEIKTIHRLPAIYPHAEHAMQASVGLAFAFGPEPIGDLFAGVLYVESVRPHTARLLPVQKPDLWVDVAKAIAATIDRPARN